MGILTPRRQKVILSNSLNMSHYTPLPLPNSHHVEDYGHFGPVVDGLVLAREAVIDQGLDVEDEMNILKSIDRRIQAAKVAYAQGARH